MLQFDGFRTDGRAIHPPRLPRLYDAVPNEYDAFANGGIVCRALGLGAPFAPTSALCNAVQVTESGTKQKQI